MRLAFWRAGSDKAVGGGTPLPKPRLELPPSRSLLPRSPAISICTRSAQALPRKRGWIIVPTVLVFVVSIAAVNLVTPRYKSEARILIDGRENVFLRPSGERNEERTALDAEAVTSQVQLLLSRDLAREIIKKNKLAERPEFDPVLQGVLAAEVAAGVVRHRPRSVLADAGRAGAGCLLRSASRPTRSTSRASSSSNSSPRDPELAARVANSIADGYLVLQQNARQEQAKAASQWLSGEIENLRKKVVGRRIPRRGFPLQIEPVRRHQQHHALQSADGRT